jgi:hypothetical protein
VSKVVSKVLWPVLGVVAIAALSVFGYAAVGGTSSAMMDPMTDPMTESVSDRITHPPLRQSFVAAPYELVVAASDDWSTPTAQIQLNKDNALLWQKTLPHQYGPRFSRVTPQGQVLLLDEYINVASPYAITLIDATGTEVAQHSFDDIKQVLADVAPADITRQATRGLWISDEPQLDASGDRALVKTGGTTIAIDLTTGELSRRDRL